MDTLVFVELEKLLIHQLCADTSHRIEDLRSGMSNRD